MTPFIASARRAFCLLAAILAGGAAQAQDAAGAAGAQDAGGAAQVRDDVMVVFDGSNSMWGQIDGKAKIEIAQGVMESLLGDWTEGRNIGLMAYGHRRRGDCTDIELLVEPGAATRQDILARIDTITPTGKTPLTDAVEQAARALSYTDRPATVVLISDGLESCERDPCALAEALERSGVGFTAHVVGFGLGADEDTASLACIAEKTGGTYVTAGNAQELAEALNTVAMAVAEPVQKPTPEPLPEPEPTPEPEPEPAPPAVTVTGPSSAVTGAEITVTWEPRLDEGDYITVVPLGTDAGTLGTYKRIGSAEEVQLPAPAKPGMYEIRYYDHPDGATLGSAALEVTDAQVTLQAPDTALAGGFFDLSWTPTINPRDYVTIVPVGTDEGTFGNYITVRDDTEGQLRAPAETGLYELRYVLREGGRTVAALPLEVTAPEVTVSGPETALAGAKVTVGWTGTVARDDYVTIVPVGTEEGVFGNYITVRDDESADLTMPAETGLYELRYVLREGSRTLAVASLEVIAPEVTVSGPDTALAGSKVAVGWTGAVARDDYVTIVPVGTDEGVFGNYITVRDRRTADLTMPAETGLYELRYVLREGSKTLATAPVEVTAPEVTVTGPDTALAGSVFDVSWTGTVNANDYVTIVPVGTEAGVYGNYFTVRNDTEHALQAPSAPGMYEIRYVLREDGSTLASAMIELTEPDVTISAPEEVRAGDTLAVSWTGTVNRHDYITIVPVGTPDDTYGAYVQVRHETALDMTAPQETGLYEVRYLMREGSRVLARQSVEVLAADAALETGASVIAPETGAPGAVISVEWSTDSTGADQRITLARADQAVFTWISAVKIDGDAPVEITLPQEPGSYEIRLLDLSDKAVLARKIITVE